MEGTFTFTEAEANLILGALGAVQCHVKESVKFHQIINKIQKEWQEQHSGPKIEAVN